MKTITIRGIDTELSGLLRKMSKQTGKSPSQIVIDTLRKHFGLTKERNYTHRYHGLDDLFGRWSIEEFDCIQGSIDSERKIDQKF